MMNRDYNSQRQICLTPDLPHPYLHYYCLKNVSCLKHEQNMSCNDIPLVKNSIACERAHLYDYDFAHIILIKLRCKYPVSEDLKRTTLS